MSAQVAGEFTREELALHTRDDFDKAVLSFTLSMALSLEAQFLSLFSKNLTHICKPKTLIISQIHFTIVMTKNKAFQMRPLTNLIDLLIFMVL